MTQQEIIVSYLSELKVAVKEKNKQKTIDCYSKIIPYVEIMNDEQFAQYDKLVSKGNDVLYS